ncbi:MAG: chromosome segregation protein SMC [Emergencia sp.]
MYFKRLEMHGFKSFAEPVVIEFHEGVTAIVGPNGSGKSNISDAIRWVLGEQSPKALRGGKMEEVIFAGTASRKSRGMAEVTLVIDNSTHILDIDYNEVAITRRMYRSGESEYLINSNQCRLRDIRELIMDTGIGVDGYSLIGQGKIADIVSNKPESRREIFEEAAGVVMYKSKKAEAERKLASTSSNLERVSDIIAEIEGRIDGLKEDSEKAREYLQLKDRYRDLEINITLKNIDNILSRNTGFREDIESLAGQIGRLEEEKQRIEEESGADAERNGILEKLGEDARGRLMETVEEINRMTSQSQLNQERLDHIEKDRERISGEIEQLTGKLEKEEENRSELENSRSEILRKYKEAVDALQEKVEAHGRLSREASELSARIDSGRERIFSLHSLIASQKSEIRSYESICETLEKRKAQLGSDAENAARINADNDAQLQEAQKRQQELNDELASLEEKIRSLAAEKQRLDEKQKRLKADMEELRLTGGQKTARKKTIEEMESNYEGYNFAVRYIMKSGLSGIQGVVAELMEVPEGLETAIETALGGQMQNIICDTDQDAKAAVNELKKNQAGRLTFLPVSSVRGSRAGVDSRISSDPGYRGLASELITCREEHRKIFDYLLGKVAITDDMDTAIRLSKTGGNGIRFVTLDGEVINASGAITGGKYKNRTANLLERKSEIGRLEEEISVLRQKLVSADRESKETAQRLSEIQRELSEKEEERQKKDVAAAALGSRTAALKQACSSARSDSCRFERELASIEKEMSDANTAAAELARASEEAGQQVSEAQSQVEEAMNLYEEKKDVVGRASEEITVTRIAATEWEGKKNSLENLLHHIEESAEDYRNQIEDRKHQLNELESEKDGILFGTENAEKDISELIEAKKETEEYIRKVQEERSELSEKLADVSRGQRERGDRLNALRDQKYQLEIKLAKNETQLDTMKERLWDDFEISYAQAQDFRREDFVMSTSVRESREIRSRIRELGEVNVGAISEYESVSQRYTFLTGQRDDITTAMEELQGIISDMDRTIRVRFKENFDQVVENFEVIFRELFGGGHAELRLEDENNPLESGIDIIAQPPGKKLQNINLMSGGEKTMTAIALMFAVLKTKPTPFCILDEVEAALDDANIDRFARYLRKFDGIQFALVTHQKATMEHADVLYGVTMPEQGISKVLSLRLGDDFDL